MLAVPARLRRHRLPVRLRGHARLERHAHTYALPVALAVLALAGCGGSSGGSSGGSDLAAVCKQQRAALASAPQPVGLRGAAEVLRRVVAMDRELLGTVDDTTLVVRIQRLDVNARRGLAAIQNTDPDRSMFPLRTGAANGRRVLSAAQDVLNDACS